jgi:secreted Zn-dependent insulinase-like peptidase
MKVKVRLTKDQKGEERSDSKRSWELTAKLALGSIFYYLKEKLWATSLSAGQSSTYRDFEFFSVTIELTPEGFSKYTVRHP